MASKTRSIKREQLKNQIGSNDINNIYHERYGYQPNITKFDKKVAKRKKRKSLKELWKMLRNKRKTNKKTI